MVDPTHAAGQDLTVPVPDHMSLAEKASIPGPDPEVQGVVDIRKYSLFTLHVQYASAQFLLINRILQCGTLLR